MRAQATNLAAQSVPVRVLWALTDIKVTPDYTLIYDNGVAIGVELGNEQSIYWHDVTQGTPEININPVLDKDNRRAAVVFGNMSSVLGQFETMDIDPTYTVAADIDDDFWGNPYGSPVHITGATTINYSNDTAPTVARGQVRISLSIPKDAIISSAYLYGYDISDQSAVSHNCYRIDETNVGSLEGDSSMPSVDKTPTATFDTNAAASDWTSIDTTDLVQAQVNLASWVAGYYIGFAFETPNEYVLGTFTFEDYSHTNSNHANITISYYEIENYVDQISDLHPEDTDIGTHSDFAEEQDKDGVFDTLTEADNGVYEYLYVDSMAIGLWTGVGTTPYLDAQDEPTNYIWTNGNADATGWSTIANTSATGSGFAVTMSFYWYCDGDGYIEWDLDWTNDDVADASGSYPTQGTYGWSTTGTISGLDTADEINDCRLMLTNNKGGGGPDNSYADAGRLYISRVEYDLDLEVGWTTADYDESNEELCIYGGTQGAEALRVDVWSGSWTNVITDLAAGWNNVSVASYLTDATFEIRFTDTTSDDAVTADTWQVEAVLLHTWSAAGEEYTEYVYEVIDLSDTSSTSVDFSTTIEEVIGLFETVVVSASFSLTVLEQIIFSDSVSVGVLYIITVLEVLGLAVTASVSAGMGITSFETIGLAATTSVFASYSTTVNELIGLADVNNIFAGFSNTVFESIGLSDTVETYQGAQYLVFEVIGLSSIATASAKYSTTINELIELAEITVPSASISITRFEVIGLLDHVITTVGGINEYYVTVYEVIGISETVTVSMGASVTILETIGLSDLTAAYRGLSITVFEIILLSSSTATSQLTHYYVNEVIGIISSVGVAGGVEPIRSMIYELFLSLEVWGYLGPAALVMGGYMLSRKELILGVLWFVLECLVVAQYLLLVEATPHYWWHIYIILFGGLIMFGFAMVGRRR